VRRRDWAPGLATFGIDCAIEDFEPGQFFNVALDVAGERCKRAYSAASAPGAELEFYVAQVSDGQFTPALFELPLGAPIQVDPVPQGFFTTSWLPPDATELWLLASGTGLGPFVSMLRAGQVFTQFERVIVAHCVRDASALGYEEELEQLARERACTYLPVVTRAAPGEFALAERFPRLLDDGSLESAAGVSLHQRSHVMLCGNPAMIADTTAALILRGLKKHRRRDPGHITVEKYW